MTCPPNHRHILLLLFTTGILSLPGCDSTRKASLVLWVTGNLQTEWLPHGDYGQAPVGGLSRLARALELYRQPGDLLVDLGRFRYPEGVTSLTRTWRLRADGFMQTLARMNYTALNVSQLDLSPGALDLAQQAQQYSLPLVSSNLHGSASGDSFIFRSRINQKLDGIEVEILGATSGLGAFETGSAEQPSDSWQTPDNVFRILMTDSPAADVQLACDRGDVDLILWLNAGAPLARRVGKTLLLGMGNSGSCLGRIEITNFGQNDLTDWDVSSWTDNQPHRHHPARESLLDLFRSWRKRPDLKASLWAVSEELAPQQQAETQRRQTLEALRRYADLEELHRSTPTAYAGSRRCLDCHPSDHPRDLAQQHGQVHNAVRSYPAYERCLPCHATGFDDPTGFLLPWERPDLLSVGCEACHGGSHSHALEGQPPYPPRPDSTICLPCHSDIPHPKMYTYASK